MVACGHTHQISAPRHGKRRFKAPISENEGRRVRTSELGNSGQRPSSLCSPVSLRSSVCASQSVLGRAKKRASSPVSYGRWALSERPWHWTTRILNGGKNMTLTFLLLSHRFPISQDCIGCSPARDEGAVHTPVPTQPPNLFHAPRKTSDISNFIIQDLWPITPHHPFTQCAPAPRHPQLAEHWEIVTSARDRRRYQEKGDTVRSYMARK